MSGIRSDRNVVRIHVPANAGLTAGQAALVKEARARFGPAVEVAPSSGQPQLVACLHPFCDPPLRGGIRIFDNAKACTGAFLARSRIDGRLYQMTAGHCPAGALGTTWSSRWSTDPETISRPIGPGHSAVFGLPGDAALIRVADPSLWSARAWVSVTAGPDTTPSPEYRISSDASSAVGMRICITGGSSSASDCGRVAELGMTITYEDGTTVSGLGRAVEMCVIPGDSGAPVYANRTAYGLVSGRMAACETLYQGIRRAEDLLGVNVSHES